jgi:hypothetical protein
MPIYGAPSVGLTAQVFSLGTLCPYMDSRHELKAPLYWHLLADLYYAPVYEKLYGNITLYEIN